MGNFRTPLALTLETRWRQRKLDKVEMQRMDDPLNPAGFVLFPKEYDFFMSDFSFYAEFKSLHN